MHQKFLDFINENSLFTRNDRVLLGISGGVDSMVMGHLFLQEEYDIGIAHCNFQLRGDESDNEEQFVRSFAEQHHIAFYSNKFDTQLFAWENKLSVQMAARKLRYQWFEELRRKYHYDYIALGHNKNDLVETFLINMTRGTGLKGMTGIKAIKNRIVRPVLFAERGEIMAYCRKYDIDYREDSSNRTVKYSRNKIRHHIIPEFQKINPRFLETIRENIERFQDAYTIYQRSVEEVKDDLVFQKGRDWYIDMEKLKILREKRTYLFEILKTYNFSKDRVRAIIDNLDSEPGKEFFSSTHILIRDRRYLIVTARQGEEQGRYYIDEHVRSIDEPIRLEFRLIKETESYEISKDPAVASVDYDKVEFPLMLRKWKNGDYFKPFGFDHLKKLSDFFVDRKYSLLDKDRTWILTTGEMIIWVVGDRPDDRVKVDEKTQRILEIRLINE